MNCLRSGDDADADADETEGAGYSEPGVIKEARACPASPALRSGTGP
jgi:hypothetical protein